MSHSSREQVQKLLGKETLNFKTLRQIENLNNPSILAAKSRVGAAAGKTWQSELYPNPKLEIEVEGIPENDLGTDRSKNKISLIHPIVISGRKSDAVSANLSNMKSQRQLLKDTRRRIQGELYIAFTKFLSQREATELYSELLEASEKTLNISKNQFEARAVLESEVIKSRIAVHELHQKQGGFPAC